MLRCGHRQGQGVTHSFMESWVGTVAKDVWLVPVVQEVVNVTHLVVCRDEPILCHFRALSDPESKIVLWLFFRCTKLPNYQINFRFWIEFSKVETKSKIKDGTRAPEVFLRRPFLAFFLSRHGACGSVVVIGLSRWPRKQEVVSELPSGSLAPIQ